MIRGAFTRTLRPVRPTKWDTANEQIIGDDEAESLFNETLKGRRRKLGNDHPATLESKNDLAVLYKEQARYEDAGPMLRKAVEGRRRKLGDRHPDTLESWHNLIDLYEAWGKTEKAEEWRAKMPQTETVEQ